jgi:hypothetical protein
MLGVESTYRRDDAERAAHPPLRIVFVRKGIAEIGQQPIAEIFRNAPTESRDDGGASVLIGANQLSQFFGIELLEIGSVQANARVRQNH